MNYDGNQKANNEREKKIIIYYLLPSLIDIA